MEYNINVLIEAANDAFYAEEEYRRFMKTWKPGWWPSKTAKEREDYTKHEERARATWNTLHMLCRLVDIDANTLVAMVKSINRWERHGGKWDRATCIHVTYRTEDSVRRALAKPQEWGVLHYNSTGRRIAA